MHVVGLVVRVRHDRVEFQIVTAVISGSRPGFTIGASSKVVDGQETQVVPARTGSAADSDSTT